MPSTSTKQAKTMSAIAHGWRPTGSAAGIPVSVAKEFHAADAGKKYGGKHKGTAGPKVADKYKRQYHREAGTPYHAHGGGITTGKNRPMPRMPEPSIHVMDFPTHQPPHKRDGVERDWNHNGGYRANDPDHPQMEPHHHLRDGTGFTRHTGGMSYPTGVSTHRHMQGTAGGHQIGARSSGRGAHTFRGMRTRHGK